MINFVCKESYGLQDLSEILRVLRAPGGCPWDAAQTHESIRVNFLEEAYEAVDAIDTGDAPALCEELGDVLMQVVFHATMAEEAGRFTMDEVMDGVCKKLIFRHPHVFGTQGAKNVDEALVNWDAQKRIEKGHATTADAMDSVARALPALWRAAKIQGKAAKSGFDWPNPMGAVDKLREEVGELEQAVAQGIAQGPHGICEEVGDVLFTAVKIARDADVDPEAALGAASDKFVRRFRKVEDATEGDLKMHSPAQLSALWRRAKEES